jgi:hypothetical protein
VLIGTGHFSCLVKVLLDLLGTLVVQSVEFWLTASLGQPIVDALDGLRNDVGCPVFDGSEQNRVTVVLIIHQKVIVAAC